MAEPTTKDQYEVLTRTCVWGRQGEVIDLTLTELQAEALLRAGTVKRAVRPVKAAVRKEKDND